MTHSAIARRFCFEVGQPADISAGEKVRLTAKERRILELIATGMTAAAVAHAEHISHRTVRKHLENVYTKLGVHDRLQAVLHCRKSGLLPE